MAKGSQKRASTAEADLPRWDLSGLFPSPDSAELKQALISLTAAAHKFQSSHAGKVAGHDPKSLALAIEEFLVFETEANRIRSYVRMSEISDPARSFWAEEIEEKIYAAESCTVFFKTEINAIAETSLIEQMGDPALSRHAGFLAAVRAMRPHALKDDSGLPSPVTETYAFEKLGTGESAWRRLYDITLREASVNVGRKFWPLGSAEKAVDRIADPDRRRLAWDNLVAAAEGEEKTLSLVFNSLVNLSAANNRLRGFKAPEDVFLLPRRIAPETAAALMEAASDYNSRLSHRYFAWKAKKAGVVRMHPADCHAPLSGTKWEKITWPQAQKFVIDAFKNFSPKAGELAERFLTSSRIDAGGAGQIFDAGSTDQPYAALDFAGETKDVLSLGGVTAQAVHMMLAAENAQISPSRTLLETSATLGKMLVFDAFVTGARNAAAERDIFMAGIEILLESSLSSAAQMNFEKNFYRLCEKDEVSPANIGALWKKSQAEYCGPSVSFETAGASKLWMLQQGVIHDPFSAPARIFGASLGMEIYDTYTNADDKTAFAEKCLSALSVGGSGAEAQILSAFSIRPAEENDWKRGFRALRRRLEHLFTLDDKVQNAVPVPAAQGRKL